MGDSEDILDTDELIVTVCSKCGIVTFPRNLCNEEIARVCRWIGENAPDAITVGGKPAIGRVGFDTMIFVAITEFPRFFDEHQLAMVWRN